MKFIFLFLYNFLEDFIHLKRIKKLLKNKIILSKPIIFDIGCHKGKLTRLFNNVYINSKIFCFEPNKNFNKSLKRIGKNINLYNTAFGDKQEIKNFILNEINLTNSFSKKNDQSFYLIIKNLIIGKKTKDLKTKVKINTIDNFCLRKKIKKIDLLKIDVEGYEYQVLLGAKKILKSVKYIMIEIQNNNMYSGYSKKKIQNFLKKNNFELVKKFNFPFMFFEDCVYKKIN